MVGRLMRTITGKPCNTSAALRNGGC